MKTFEYNNVPLHYINYVLRLPVGNTIGDYSGGTKIKLSLIDFTSEKGFDWSSVKNVQILGNPFYCADCDNTQEETNEALGKSGTKDGDNSSTGNNNSELQPIPSDTSIIIGDMISGKGVMFRIGTCGLNVIVMDLNDNGEYVEYEIYRGSRNEFGFTLDLNKYLNNVLLHNIINNGELLFYDYNATFTASEFLLTYPIFAEALQLTYGKSESLMSMKTLYEVELINNFDYSKIIRFAFDAAKEPFTIENSEQIYEVNLYDKSIEYTEEDENNHYVLLGPKLTYGDASWELGTYIGTVIYMSDDWDDFARNVSSGDNRFFTDALLYEILRTGTLKFSLPEYEPMPEEYILLIKLSILVTCADTNVINTLSPVPAVINIDEEFAEEQPGSPGGSTYIDPIWN